MIMSFVYVSRIAACWRSTAFCVCCLKNIVFDAALYIIAVRGARRGERGVRSAARGARCGKRGAGSAARGARREERGAGSAARGARRGTERHISR